MVYAYCSLDKAVACARHIQLPAHAPPPRKGDIMHKYPQNQSSVGSSGQTITTDVSMTPCNWQIVTKTLSYAVALHFVRN